MNYNMPLAMKVVKRTAIVTMITGGALLLPLITTGQALTSSYIRANDIYTAGDNTTGEVGNGAGQYHTSATQLQLPAGLTALQVIQTGANTYIRASNNQVYATGGNFNGELGLGDSNLRTAPEMVPLPGGATAVSIYSYARDHNEDNENLYILASNGNVYATGSNSMYTLGGGQSSTYVATSPERFQLPAGVHAVDVAAHYRDTYVLGDDGNVYGAGENNYGELGNGVSIPTSTPVKLQLPGGKLVSKFAHYDSLYTDILTVITTSGEVYSAGDNYYGGFGDGTTASPQETAVKFQLPAGVTANDAYIAYYAIYVIGSDGHLYGAGSNGGALGNGSTSDIATPAVYQLPAGVSATNMYIPTWGGYVLVKGDDGNLYGSGNHDGALGTGNTATVSTPVKWPIPGGAAAVDVRVDYTMAMVRANDGNAYVAGSNSLGELGTGNTTPVLTPIRYNTPVGLTVTDISATLRDTLFTIHAVAGGRVFGSGLNKDAGSLGDGTLTNTNQVREMVLPVGVVAKGVNAYRENLSSSTCVTSTVNSIYCAGRNMYGQLGDGGETAFVLTPEKFKLPAGVYGVRTYQTHESTQFVLGSDNQLYGAGVGSSVAVGNGNPQYTPVKFPLPSGVNVVDVTPVYPSTGNNGKTILVLGSNGVVYGAGDNFGGVLGNGTTNFAVTPQVYQLPAGVKATKFLVSNGDFILAGILGTDNKLYFAGPNSLGRLGNGSSAPTVSTPTVFQLPAGVIAVKIAQSGESIHVLASDGKVYSAGRGTDGQLGDGSFVDKSTPVQFQLPGGLTATDVVANWHEVYVLASNGRIYGAGQNEFGQLGDGTNTPRSTPVQFQLPAGVTVSSFKQTLTPETRNFSVLASDGNVYSTGTNARTDFDGNTFATLGTAAPNGAGEFTPVKYLLPAGVTVTKLVQNRHTWTRVVVGSDGKVYSSGTNQYGQLGIGTTVGSNLPVQMHLPSGKSATDAWGDFDQWFVKTSDNSVYGVGCNDIFTLCGGSLGVGSSKNVLTPRLITLPVGFVLGDVQGNAYSTFSFVGGEPFCDANGSGTQDSGDFPMQGQNVTLYPSAGGAITGAAVATYTASPSSTSNVFYFDGLADGEYVAGIATTSGVMYSEPMFITGSGGDGWVLGNASYAASISAMGETGFVCGASTVVPPSTTPPSSTTPSAPGAPGSTTPSTPGTILAPTGIKIGIFLLIASALCMLAFVIMLSKTSSRKVLVQFHDEVDDALDTAFASINGRSWAEIASELGLYVPSYAATLAELSRSGQVDVMLDGTIVSRDESA